MLLACVKAHLPEEVLWGCTCGLADGSVGHCVGSADGDLKGFRILPLLILDHLLH